MENFVKDPSADGDTIGPNGLESPSKMKKWDNLRGENAWTMFKVMAEFVEGFEILNRVGRHISIA